MIIIGFVRVTVLPELKSITASVTFLILTVVLDPVNPPVGTSTLESEVYTGITVESGVGVMTVVVPTLVAVVNPA